MERVNLLVSLLSSLTLSPYSSARGQRGGFRSFAPHTSLGLVGAFFEHAVSKLGALNGCAKSWGIFFIASVVTSARYFHAECLPIYGVLLTPAQQDQPQEENCVASHLFFSVALCHQTNVSQNIGTPKKSKLNATHTSQIRS